MPQAAAFQPRRGSSGKGMQMAHQATQVLTPAQQAHVDLLVALGIYSADDDSDDDEANEPEHCTACNGSGEGMYDGTRCSTCRGKGVVYFRRDDECEGDDE